MPKAVALIGASAVVVLAIAAGAPGALRDGHGLTRVDSGRGFVPGEVIVRYKPGAARAGRAAVVNSIDATRKQFLLLPRAELLDLPTGLSVDSAVRTLEARPDVQYAEPNWIYYAQATPDDTRFGELWGLNNTGQPISGVPGTPDADIDAPEAWEQTTGSKDVVVAVADTGIAYDHPELAANIVPGWDFIMNDDDPRDLNGHGTHVAGTIGARGNNAAGVVGVNWNVSLMPVRVLGADGSGTNATVANGFAYAGDHSAKVVNASLGCTGVGCFSQAISDAITGHPNSLYVVAAGNNGTNNDLPASPTYPCDYRAANLICVAATDKNDTIAGFSNYGTTNVDLAAPGVEILSTWPAYDDVFSDGFETAGTWTAGGNPNTWDRTTTQHATGSFSATDSPGGAYQNNANNWFATTGGTSFAGRFGCQAAYDLSLETEYGYDFFIVETSPNGTAWTLRDSWTGTTQGAFFPLSTDLSPLDGAPSVFLRFRLQSDLTNTFDGAYVDNAALRCISTSYDASDFDSIAGTSMATPHVAGVAALLWAKKPTATVAEVRSALLNSVDVRAALATKVATAGRLNADRALTVLTAPPPPPPQPPTPPQPPAPQPPGPPPPPPPAPQPPAPRPVKKKVTKVTLCHRGRTIKVTKSAVKKYRKHGDKLGRCRKPKKKHR